LKAHQSIQAHYIIVPSASCYQNPISFRGNSPRSAGSVRLAEIANFGECLPTCDTHPPELLQRERAVDQPSRVAAPCKRTPPLGTGNRGSFDSELQEQAELYSTCRTTVLMLCPGHSQQAKLDGDIQAPSISACCALFLGVKTQPTRKCSGKLWLYFETWYLNC